MGHLSSTKPKSSAELAALETYLTLKYGSEKEIHRIWFAHVSHPTTLVPEGDIKLIAEWLEYEYLD